MNEEQNLAQDIQVQKSEPIKLDYTLESYEERLALVNKIIESTPSEKLTSKYLERLADYLIFTKYDETRDTGEILTENRKYTVNKHETSFEGLAAVFESEYNENGNSSGEDAIYNLITDNKNIILTPKIKITEEDIAEVPGLKELVDEIERMEQLFKEAKGKARYSIKQNIIALRKDQYVLKASHKGSINCMNATKSSTTLDIYEDVTVDENGDLHVESNLSLLIPQHVSALLCNYSRLKGDSYGKFNSDMYYMIRSLEDLIDSTLALEYPLYFDLLVYKIDGMSNNDIQRELEQTFGFRYSVEHISSLWRNKIPKILAEQAQKNWLECYYTNEKKGNWKRCSRCGQIKLAHNKFFSKNKTSKDGFYSICKDCRNKKVGSVKD